MQQVFAVLLRLKVFLNVYDVPANGSENMTAFINKLNKVGRELGTHVGQ